MLIHPSKWVTQRAKLLAVSFYILSLKNYSNNLKILTFKLTPEPKFK